MSACVTACSQRHRVAGLASAALLEGRRLQAGIVAEGLVVVAIFVTEYQRMRALADQCHQPLLTARLAPRVV